MDNINLTCRMFVSLEGEVIYHEPKVTFNPLTTKTLGRELWKEVHSKQDPNSDWFKEWCSRVPEYSCGCRSWLMNYVTQNPPRFEDWLTYTWQLHNAVNAKPEMNKQQQCYDDTRACWLGIAPQTKSRLVITIATGSRFIELLQHTRPLLEQYATRCNADFVVLTNQQFDQWQREKFRVYDFAQQYEETLFIDSDCVIRPTTQDLFEVCQGYDVGMHDDLSRVIGPWDWQAEYDRVLRSQDIESIKTDVLWNTGVVYCTRKSADIWKPPVKPLPNVHCSEQFYVQYQSQPYRIKSLPSDHNWQFWFPQFNAHIKEAHIVHLANCKDKLTHVKQYV